jgi:predicted nucleic acid-binding protein
VATALLQAREIDFVPCSELFFDVWATFRDQPDGGRLSFTDAALVTVARRDVREQGYVATFDADFKSVPGLAVIPD